MDLVSNERGEYCVSSKSDTCERDMMVLNAIYKRCSIRKGESISDETEVTS